MILFRSYQLRCGLTPRIRAVAMGLVLAQAGSLAMGQAPEVEFTYAPGIDTQIDGPTYDYRVSRYEIRNDQFVEFLNDALGNLGNSRGAYMYFDTTTGDVYINLTQTGFVGIGVGGRSVLMFRPSSAGQIGYNGNTGFYQAVTTPLDFSAQPVTGLTWYGALKYCNWLTLENGLGEGERAYTEGTDADLNLWRPVSITASNWSARDLNAEERAAMVLKQGFRLPMDGGIDGVNAYGEWFKVAAARRDTPADPVTFDAIYGFGRAALEGVDANYSGSGDFYEVFVPGLTPVGFYDGVNFSNSLLTRDTQNGYGLYDITGNAWEWMQDQVPGDPLRRRNRGGSWRNASAALLQIDISGTRLATSQDDGTGLRVVQSVAHPLRVTPPEGIVRSGPWDGPYDGGLNGGVTYAVTNLTGTAVDVAVTADADWVTITPDTPTLLAGESLDIIVAIAPVCADVLPVGVSDAEVTFAVVGVVSESTPTRPVSVTVTEPLTVTPATGFDSALAMGGTPFPASQSYTLLNGSVTSVSWSASWSDTSDPTSAAAWLLLNGAATATGSVLGSNGSRSIDVDIDQTVAATLAEGLYTADITLTDDCTGETFVRGVSLTVSNPFTVSPDGTVPIETSGVFGGPFEPATLDFLIAWSVGPAITWSAQLCAEAPGSETCTVPGVAWLSLAETSGVVLPNGSFNLSADVNALANTFEPGDYSITVRISQDGTGFFVDREVILTVTGLQVVPADDVGSSGPVGGPFAPATLDFTLTNDTATQMEWAAALAFTPTVTELGGLTWVSIAPGAGVILDPGGTQVVTATITADAIALAPGTYTVDVTFVPNSAPLAASVRTITLRVTGEGFSVPMVLVPGSTVQTGGPAHDYRIGQFEITNTEFARFLNDARRNTFNARGQFMYFDTSTGDVFITPVAEAGTVPPSGPDTASLFAASLGRIAYDAGQGEPFVIEAGFEDHPVVGVSWYGAVKFCNWLTVLQGMPPSEQAYTEGPIASDWQPVAFDPADEIDNRVGYRLPMDGGVSGIDAVGEWYKAAAFTGLDLDEVAMFDAVYGFGRDALTDADANYLGSGATVTDATTAVGFFDGTNQLVNETVTVDTGNEYDLYDLSGNVAEWVHELDLSGAEPQSATRGGHFLDADTLPALRNDHRIERPVADTLSFVGFRIAQSLSPVAVTLTQAETDLYATGPVGGAFDRMAFTLQVESAAAYTLDDVSYAVSSAGAWLSPDGTPPEQIPPGAVVDLLLEVTDSSNTLAVSPSPVEDMALVPVSDEQISGPAHDYWIARTEVTNAQFAAFLNSARADALVEAPETPGFRSSFMLFHTLTGSVYMNAEETAAVVDTALGMPVPELMYDASVGRVQFAGGTYSAEAGFETHPVVGVTWFGAVKYCNWLTIERGFPAAMRAYIESGVADEWRPVSVNAADWSTRGITDAERRILVRSTIGYRLPMDGGAVGASAFNEWLKAGAARVDVAGAMVFDAAYGFGRDTLAGDAANFSDSGDTEQDETTPIKFFDGVRRLFDDETLTQDSENRYGIADLTGNVAEWMQDPTNGSPAERGVRGGSWRDAIASPLLRVDGRTAMPPGTVNDETGFRITRGTGHFASITMNDKIAVASETKYIILDVTEPIRVSPVLDLDRVGPFCSDFTETPQPVLYTVNNASDTVMPIAVSTDQSWVTLLAPDLTDLSGEVPAGGSIAITVSTNASVNDLLPGTHSANVLITRTTTPPVTFFRHVEVEVEPSATVAVSTPDPTYSGFWEVSLSGPADLTMTLERCPTCDACTLDYAVTVSETWLTVGPEGSLTGELPPSASPLALSVALDETADALPPGAYTATVRFTLIDPALGPLPGSLEETVTLNVLDPIAITGDGTDWSVPCAVDTALRQRVYTLFNNHGTSEISVDVSTDVDWIDIDQPVLSVAPGAEASVTFSLNEFALPTVGEFAATLSFRDRLTDFVQTFDVLLRIDQELCATPLVGFNAWGASGGAVTPPVAGYTLVNLSDAISKDWQVSVDQPWVLVNGAPANTVPISGILAPGERYSLVVSIDEAALPTLPAQTREGSFTATVAIADAAQPIESVTREVVVHLTNPVTTVDEALVAAASAQPGGPGYSFFMDRYHTTNEAFVVFLNDALSQSNDPRGAHLFFDTTTGDVYVNDAVTGAVGADPGARTTLVFSPSASGQIEFAAGAYAVVAAATDYARHPVTGVSWFGAVKYANWLTLDQGFGADARCYEEATDADLPGWRPRSIAAADWLTRDLNDQERRRLVNDYRGYRLPMDDGFNNPDRTVDAADAFNEWYKAAAWSQLPGANGFTNTQYGFGRNILTAADANYRCSQDPFEDVADCAIGGSTPAGFYDGSTQTGGFVTEADNNGFGLFDMSGNVHTWLQGKYTSTGLEDRRTLRGGSWDDTSAGGNLVLTNRLQFAPRQITDRLIGFRLVRALPLPGGDVDADGDIDLADVSLATACQLGPDAGLGAACGAVDFNGDQDVDLRDLGEVINLFGTNP